MKTMLEILICIYIKYATHLLSLKYASMVSKITVPNIIRVKIDYRNEIIEITKQTGLK